MTPLGHTATSFIMACKWNRPLPIAVSYAISGSLIPDIDFIAFFWDELNRYHRTYTHSIGFLALCLSVLFFAIRKNRLIALYSFGLGFLLHLVIDAAMDANPSNGIGIPLLWPFYDGYIHWFDTTIQDKAHAAYTWHTPWNYIGHRLGHVLLIELPFYLYAAILLRRKVKK